MSAHATQPGGAAGAPSNRVLIADDDPTMVLLLEHVLQALGREYDIADDGAAAWDSWSAARHRLMVLDIEMPKMDGLEICRRIREADTSRETFILVVTGRDKPADLEAVMSAGADDYVSKPTTGERLLARLRIAQRRMENDASHRKAEADLRKAQWLAGIGEANMAIQHEINNPLTGLLATAEMMLMESKESGLPREDIKTIIDQARRIAELVKRMGELSDPKTTPYTGKRQMLDLRDKG